jgi:aspartate kinase
VAAEHVNVDTILQNVGHESAELSFSVPKEDVSATRRALDQAQQSIGPIEIDEVSDLGKISLVGAGMRSHPGVAAKMFRTLADQEINLRLISTSPIKVSCLIVRSDVERAVRALHDAFLSGDDGPGGDVGSPPE